MRILFFVPNDLWLYDCRMIVYPPLGLLYLASTARNDGHTVKFIDAEALNLSQGESLSQISEYKPDVIAISITTPQFPIAKDFIPKIKKSVPNAYVIVGGPHPSITLQDMLRDIPQIDYAIYGEGEVAFSKLLECLSRKGDISAVPSLIYTDSSGDIKITAPEPLINNIDNISLPAYDLISQYIDLYPGTFPSKAKPSLHIMASRGCPFSCSFCSNAVYGKKTRFRSVESVVNEVEFLYKEFNVREIFFQDDTLNYRTTWLTNLCEELIKKGLNNKIQFKAPFRVNKSMVTPEIMKMVKKAGFWMIFYGVESGNQDILNNVSKGISLEEIISAFRITRQAGLHTHASFMVGNIGETTKTVAQSVDLVKLILPDTYWFSVAIAFPGTRFYREAKEKGLIVNDEYVDKGYPSVGITRTEALSREEITQLAGKAALESFEFLKSSEAKQMVKQDILDGFSPEMWEKRKFYVENRFASFWDFNLISPLDLIENRHYYDSLVDNLALAETTGFLGEGWGRIENWNPPKIRHFNKRGRIYLKRKTDSQRSIIIHAYSGYPDLASDPIRCKVEVNNISAGEFIFI